MVTGKYKSTMVDKLVTWLLTMLNNMMASYDLLWGYITMFSHKFTWSYNHDKISDLFFADHGLTN